MADAVANIPAPGQVGYIDALAEAKRPTAVFKNRPAWVAPTRAHPVHAFAQSNPRLALGFGVAGVLGAGAMIIKMMGGNK